MLRFCNKNRCKIKYFSSVNLNIVKIVYLIGADTQHSVFCLLLKQTLTCRSKMIQWKRNQTDKTQDNLYCAVWHRQQTSDSFFLDIHHETSLIQNYSLWAILAPWGKSCTQNQCPELSKLSWTKGRKEKTCMVEVGRLTAPIQLQSFNFLSRLA